MAELFKYKRAIFKRGKQKEFLAKIKNKTNLTWPSLANYLKISNRTLTDWKREKFSMRLDAVRNLCKIANIQLPKNIKIKNPFWYVKKAALKGGLAVYKKYGQIGGDLEYRKRKWDEWWKNKGKYKKHPFIGVALPIKTPKQSNHLAEFVGILMGDGGISKNQVTITLNSEDDKEYTQFVIKLIKKLFGVMPKIYPEKIYHANNIVISRINLVRFCVEKLGLKIGNKIKQQIDIPLWIKKNKKFKIHCLRGLIDTDGSIFTHRYKINGKLYLYKKLDFSSMSQPLRQSVYEIFKSIGLHPRMAQNKSVRLDRIEDVKKYFYIVNSHNTKHLKRYYN